MIRKKAAIAIAASSTFLIGGLVFYWIHSDRLRSEKLAASAKINYERTLADIRARELAELAEASDRKRKYKEEMKKIEQIEKAQSIKYSAATANSSAGGGGIPPLTSQEIAKCVMYMKYKVQDNSVEGSRRFQFESDRDKAVATWQRAYDNAGCAATEYRQRQISQAVQEEVRRYLYGN